MTIENKNDEMEIIVAVAIKTKEGEVFVSRYSHSELIVMFPDKFRNAKQGFLTSKCRFVDRKDALKIANRYNQIKHGMRSELYSEDIFFNEHMQKIKIEKLQKENEELKGQYAEYVKLTCNEVTKNSELNSESNSAIKEKNKIINAMSKYIAKLDIDEDICKKMGIFKDCEIKDVENCKKCIIKYFKNKYK